MANLKSHEALVAELRRTIEELESLVAEQRERLVQAEAALETERARVPAVGDFARSTLTNFYGRVTKVTARADGRAWVEINPYLTPTLPGRSTLDLFDAWEIIDDPADSGQPGVDVTGVEIVAQLTESLAMFAPSRAMGIDRGTDRATQRGSDLGTDRAEPPPSAAPTAGQPAPQPPGPKSRKAVDALKALLPAGDKAAPIETSPARAKRPPADNAAGTEPAHGPN